MIECLFRKKTTSSLKGGEAMPSAKLKGGKIVAMLYHEWINLTSHHVGFYDDNLGSIVVANPGDSSKQDYCVNADTMVIVTNKSEALAFGIPEENAVHICHNGIGHDGVRVSRFERLCDDFPAVYSALTSA